MKIHARLALFAVIASLVFSVLAVTPSHADELSNEQKDRISANCVSIKASLSQLHASDALLRVNRGQFYESVGTKLMSNFNARLNNNGLDNQGLVGITESYTLSLSAFRSNYQTYERQLAVTLKIDCTKDQAAFHDSLINAREKRTAVHADVTRLNRYIKDYRSAVDDFMLNYERVTGRN
jgi:hypothetical protein